MRHFEEAGDDRIRSVYPYTRVLHSFKSAVGQEIVVLEHPDFGAMLFIDMEGQSAEKDEAVYHEALVHPAMVTANAVGGLPAKRVLILGGGEGASLREVCKYPDVKEITMIDFDQELVHLFRDNFPSWHAGSFSDPRVRLQFADVRKALKEDAKRYDVIIVDLTDAFTLDADFLGLLARHAHEDTSIVIQAGQWSQFRVKELKEQQAALAACLPGEWTAYHTYVPFFQSEWTFFLNSNELPQPKVAVPTATLSEDILRAMFVAPRWW
jgi:spermidine synthase